MVNFISQIAYYQLLGRPVIFHLGMLTLGGLIFTAIVGYLNYRGYGFLPFKLHRYVAYTTLVIALIHGLMGFMSYF